MRERTARSVALALAVIGALLAARPCAAQDRVRVGVVFGGLGFIGAVVEGIWEDRSAELVVSTFTLHDVSVSVAGKQFFGASWLKPALGAGVAWMGARGEDGFGSAVIARFPLGGDWKITPGHYVTWEVNVTRAPFVRRPDPTDTSPPTQRIIPFPSLSYRIGPGEL